MGGECGGDALYCVSRLGTGVVAGRAAGGVVGRGTTDSARAASTASEG